MKMTDLKKANNLFRKGDLVNALTAYSNVQLNSPELASIAQSNISLIKHRIAKLSQENAPSSDYFNHENCTGNLIESAHLIKIAVVFHVYHESIVSEILDYISNIDHDFDMYITTPLSRSSRAIGLIYERYPNATYFHAVNRGRDILPFLNVFEKISNYDLCLKLHTKQGLTNYGDLWRDVSLQCLLKSKDFVSELVDKFSKNNDVVMAGPKDFYLSGRRLIHGNHQNLTQICSTIGVDYAEGQEWAFFAGTMFWFKPVIFNKYINSLKHLEFEKETGRQDGGVEHSIERVFGLIPSYAGAKALLLSGYDSESNIDLVKLPEKVGVEDPTKYLSNISKIKLQKKLISGDVNKQSSGALADMKVRGWLAKLDDKTPRSFIVRIGSQEFEGTANVYRSDLDEANIHDGCHAFEVNVPLKFADGNEHMVGLFDKKTGLPVANNKYKWNAIKRPYSNFKEYLSWSYSGQFVSIPFVEEDKRSFSVMELIANDLTALSETLDNFPLVSIVMPTFNRSTLIKNAINSVLQQKYKYWELLIVDDGSTDDTEEVVMNFKDSRINYEVLTKNVGVSEARNHALKKAKGDYIAYLDSDNDWDPRYLASMIAAAEFKLKKANALYSGQLVHTGKKRELSGVRFGMFNKALLKNNNFIDLNCFIHKRLLSCGLPQFDSSLKRFVDWDFIATISNFERVASSPVLLSNYYLDISDNSLTSNDSLLSYINDVRLRIEAEKEKKKIFYMPARGLFNGISIVIPSYQAKVDIDRCIKSIEPYLDMKSEFKVELIIVDNNSNKAVVDFLRDFANLKKESVRLVELETNYGFTYAINRGIELAKKGNDILLLNNDALLTGAALYELQKPLYEEYNYGLAVPSQILPGGTETICTHVPYALPEYDADVNISVHHKNLTNPPLFYEGDVCEVDFAPFFCVLIKGDTLKNAPSLDVLNGRHYRSDRTYCEYIRTSFGLKIAYCPDSVVYHGLQKSTVELRNKLIEDGDYKKIFIQNTWTNSELNDMGLNLPKWNINF